MADLPVISEHSFKSGFVALVGRPSVGKSTLLNACLKEKIAITSPVAQTTRRRLRGVVNGPNSSWLLLTRPGCTSQKTPLAKSSTRLH